MRPSPQTRRILHESEAGMVDEVHPAQDAVECADRGHEPKPILALGENPPYKSSKPIPL